MARKALLLAALCLCIGDALGDREFHNLEKLKADDSWLSLDTWNPIRVAEFIDFIAPEFPECTLKGSVWQEHSITGSFLKTQIWSPLTDSLLKAMKFDDDDDKFTKLGFPEDTEERAKAIKAVRARIDKEFLRRSDAKFRKRLQAQSSGKQKAAREKLGFKEGELPTEAQVRKYKIKQLRLFFEMLGMDPAAAGKEKEDMQKAALDALAARQGNNEL